MITLNKNYFVLVSLHQVLAMLMRRVTFRIF